MTTELKWLLIAAGVAILGASLFIWRYGIENSVQTKDDNRDTVATAALLLKAQVDTDDAKLTAALATKAALDAHHALAQYIADHPVPAISVCVNPPGARSGSVQARRPADPHPSSALPEPAVGGSVPAGSPGHASGDIGPAADTIVSSFGELAIRDAECQKRITAVKPVP